MGVKTKTTEWFKQKVKEYHGDKVEVLSEYLGSEKPIKILYHCEKHGDTEKTINAKNVCKPYFLPCKQCQSENKSKSAAKRENNPPEYYYERMKKYCEDRGGQFLSDKWITAKTRYKFKCGNPDHPVFTSTADALYSGSHWCPYCCGRKGNFQEEIEEIVKSKDGILLTEYKTAYEYVRVKCNKDGYEWDVTPANLKKGRWCPICNMNFSEKVMYDCLKELTKDKYIIIPQYSFDDLRYKDENEPLRFDFAILNKNGTVRMLIELDGEEHRHNHKSKRRLIAKERDCKKDEYCKLNNIRLYRHERPFRLDNKWSYDDYYSYIYKELKNILND